MNPSRKPDWRVATPSQLDPDRWIDVGAAWRGRSRDGEEYISVQLDVMPTIGKLTLFPIRDKKKKQQALSPIDDKKSLSQRAGELLDAGMADVRAGRIRRLAAAESAELSPFRGKRKQQ